MSNMATQGKYMQVTPSGAYYATVASDPDDARALLLQLLSAEGSFPYSDELVMELADLDQESAVALFDKLYSRGFLAMTDQPIRITDQSIEQLLPEVLPHLADSGNVILADDQGFCLGNCGYELERAESLAALAADVILLHERHHQLLNRDLQFSGESWGIVDPVGHSQLGIWVVYVGVQKFSLIIQGMPKFNQQAFVDLLSALARRYLEY